MELLCFFVLLLTLRFSLQDELPIVRTNSGIVRGHYKYSYENRPFAAFEGIPYGKPPVGDLRFEAPKNAEPWSGILDTTVVHECAQHIKPDLADKNEDCLYINVYVPRKEVTSVEKLDVIVQIHGGAFMLSGPDLAGPEFIMDKDVIYVNLNYRLGVFGFLSTGDDVVPGNNGLKDQVLALEWVKSNIHHFGGNPNSVTIVGVSAGAASVHLHYFSDLSKGLFHRGISHSGTALGAWSLHLNPLESTLKIAETVSCTQSSIKDVVKCLKTKSAAELSTATFSVFKCFSLPVAPFAPVIEKPSKTAFLTDDPHRLLEKGSITDVPWISSITEDEGLVVYFFVTNMEEIIDKWPIHSPYILNYFDHVADVDKSDISKKIKNYYFGDSPIIDDGIIRAIGDRLFNVPMQKSVELQAKVSKSPVYSYVYSYINDLSFPAEFVVHPHKKGADHGSDGILTYDASGFRFAARSDGKLSENDEWIKSFLVDIVTSFAADGTPKPRNGINWKPVTNNKDWSYLHIKGKDNVTIEYNKDSKLNNFWDSLGCDSWNRKSKIKDEF